jgi:hypothetical protein
MEVHTGKAFDAKITLGKRVACVPANPKNLVAFYLDEQTAQ